ncbi:MAG: helix-turn-helix domain-containing protein [Clostridia bacterium]|nr:helix-turn-helix domain-containing protein [Clostridia bacterium]
MTLGRKLSNYRKLMGMTQQQLGDQLNLSAQAISKWENDLAEPDLTTLKTLANLYKVSLDDLLDVQVSMRAPTQIVDADAVAASITSAIDEKLSEEPKTVGFCKVCGIAVTEENLGVREPVVKCKKCVEAEKRAAREREEKARIERENEKKAAERKLRANRYNLTAKRNKSLIVGGIVAGLVLLSLIVALVQNFSFDLLLAGIVFTYCVFSFVSMLFYDTPVINVISYMCTASIKWPGLIFTFDLDGFLWLIGMKLLFAVLGFLFGLACAVLGLILGLAIAPFVFPYIMVKIHRDLVSGTIGDYVEI